jgi:L-rhamnose mutarotase
MQRICFILKLHEEHLDDYVERHKHVWPDMQEALRATGWTNYSLFLAPGGLLIGYVEVEDFAAAREGMKAFPVNARWQLEMAPFFDNSNTSPDDAMKPLQEVFHLD